MRNKINDHRHNYLLEHHRHRRWLNRTHNVSEARCKEEAFPIPRRNSSETNKNTIHKMCQEFIQNAKTLMKWNHWHHHLSLTFICEGINLWSSRSWRRLPSPASQSVEQINNITIIIDTFVVRTIVQLSWRREEQDCGLHLRLRF